MTSPQQVFQCFGSETAWTKTASDSAYVRVTCNASLRRDVTGFVGSVKEIKLPIIVREVPVKREKRERLNFLPRLKHKRSRYRYLAAHLSFMRLPMTINVIGIEGLATSQCHLKRALETPSFFGDR
jgi:hypothetical protein